MSIGAQCQYSKKAKDDFGAESETPRKKKTHICSVCKYESNRVFNVTRHEYRIHERRIVKACCDKIFYTKGDYYVHCEDVHPEKRSYAISSRMKYKLITNPFEIDVQLKKQLQIQRRRRGMKQKLNLNYFFTCDFDIEDIPLINFLTDKRLNAYWKMISSKSTNERSKKSEDKEQNGKLVISSKQSIEEELSRDKESNFQKKVSNSFESSLSMELPTKKLILHRFRCSSRQDFNCKSSPLREQNNIGNKLMNFEGKQDKENISSVLQSRSKHSKRFNGTNRENVATIAFDLQQQLNIKLDTGITVPVVTQLHRDFLDAIDFDKFKIF